MELNESRSSWAALDLVDNGDLASGDIVGDYEDAYASAATRIRAVGTIINDGKRVRNLNVAIALMEDNAKEMISLHNIAKKLFATEAHCFCGRPRSEVFTLGGHATNWTAGLAAIGFSVVSLKEQDDVDKTASVGRSIATLCLGVFQLFQGWVADKKLEQVTYEQDLLLLLKTSPGRVKYVKSMIAIYKSWASYQEVAGSGHRVHDEKARVDQIISTIDQLPVKPKEKGGFCRRDMFEALMQTESGRELYGRSQQLQAYKKLVDAEYKKGDGKLIEEHQAFEEQEVDFVEIDSDFTKCKSARVFIKEIKAEKSPIKKKLRHRRGEGRTTQIALASVANSPNQSSTMKSSRRSLSGSAFKEDDLNEFVSSSCFCCIDWNLALLTKKIEGKYRIAENQTAAIGTALKTHGAAAVDFQISIQALQEVLLPITLLENISQHILNTDKKMPAMAGLKAQQHYRTALNVILTLASFGTSTAETIVEFLEEESNNTLKVISFIALLLAQTGTVIDSQIQGSVFKKMREQSQLRNILARKYSTTISAMIKYLNRCQKAIDTGADSDLEIAFQTRVPNPVTTAISMTDIATHILTCHEKKISEERELQKSSQTLSIAVSRSQRSMLPVRVANRSSEVRFEDSDMYKQALRRMDELRAELDSLSSDIDQVRSRACDRSASLPMDSPVRSRSFAADNEPEAERDHAPRRALEDDSAVEIRMKEERMQALLDELRWSERQLQEDSYRADLEEQRSREAFIQQQDAQCEFESARNEEELESQRAAQFDTRVRELAKAAVEREAKITSVSPQRLQPKLEEEELDLMWDEVDSEEETDWSRRLDRLERSEENQRQTGSQLDVTRSFPGKFVEERGSMFSTEGEFEDDGIRGVRLHEVVVHETAQARDGKRAVTSLV